MTTPITKNFGQESLRRACEAFGLDVDQATLIRDNQNLIYDCGDKILRITHSSIRTRADIVAELNWQVFLFDHQLPVARVNLSKAKRFTVLIDVPESSFTAVCFDKIFGKKISRADWGHEHFTRLGQLTGQLHRIGNQYESKNSIVYKDWDTIIEFSFYQYLPEDHRELKSLHAKLVTELQQLPKREDNYGLIHYDIHHGNYLLLDRKPVLFDFEMTCRSWLINDIATVLYYANHFPKSPAETNFNSRFLTPFWNGYQREYSINEAEKKWIPKFLLYRDLMVLGFVSRIWADKPLVEKQKKYIAMIEAAIEKRRTGI